MNKKQEDILNIQCKPSLFALSPIFVSSTIINDFYKVPITVAFLLSSAFSILISRGKTLNERIVHFSAGASNGNIMLMIWIFILAGAFAQSAKSMGAIDATVNLTLQILPNNLLLAGMFIAACLYPCLLGHP